MNMLAAVSDITRAVDRAFWLIGGMSLVLLVGITIAMIVLAIRFRRSRARTTNQTEGHTGLEIVWTVIPTVIVIWMFFVGYEGFSLMGKVPENAMVVEVTGRQWMWAFSYPEDHVESTEMVVPVNQPVLVKLTAPPDDVVHSFFIPDFRVKEDALPGQATSLWFEAEREGTYTILCAEFCGKDHSQMISLLRVVSREAYGRWILDQQMKKFRPLEFEAVTQPDHPGFGEEELNIDSRALFSAFCASCHGASGDGSGLPGVARDLTSLSYWRRSAKVTDIYRTLTEGIEGSQMRAFPNLTPWQRVGLAHYVRTLVREPLPSDAKEDYDRLVAEYGLDKVQAPKETISIEKAMEIMAREADQP